LIVKYLIQKKYKEKHFFYKIVRIRKTKDPFQLRLQEHKSRNRNKNDSRVVDHNAMYKIKEKLCGKVFRRILSITKSKERGGGNY
jgi:hypothetical protein